ncbi:MAG: alpha/beta fold hydrolase [Bacteroidales bacterium]|jgi:dienelactone hydrolase|nr:alpha/beta fold hydrolase [Bacteroidales bacterium]
MKKFYLSIVVVIISISTAFPKNIQGSWNGTLNTGMLKLRIVFHIEQKNGTYTATMDSPDQKAKGLPTTSVRFFNDTLTINAANMAMTYTAVLQGELLSGIFVQGSNSIPLELKRGEATEIKRPQDPIKPYPYHSEDLKFENKKAGITLAGTLTLPKDGKNFSAVVLLSGSGPQNRNEELLGHRPFLVLSDYLTRNDIAVLRYDDRGVAESTGDYKTATLDDFTTDAAAAVAYLKTRKEINPKKIGIVGHSEGGTIGLMLAGKSNNDLAFIVSMAGATVKGDTLMKAQRYAIYKAMGVADEWIEQNERLIEK